MSCIPCILFFVFLPVPFQKYNTTEKKNLLMHRIEWEPHHHLTRRFNPPSLSFISRYFIITLVIAASPIPILPPDTFIFHPSSLPFFPPPLVI